MEITDRRKFRKTKKREQLGYSASLQFYQFPPSEDISLREFEDFAVERLKVLKAVETAGLRFMRGTEEYNECLRREAKNLNVQRLLLIRDESGAQQRLDHISHFILRLAYCKSEDLRRWFLTQEMDLFRFRFVEEKSEKITKEFLETNNLKFEPISSDEQENFQTELKDCSYKISQKFYKVPFTDALDLVRTKKVFLHLGFAFVARSDLVVLVLTHFRSHLSQALTIMMRLLPHIQEDSRLLLMLSGLSKRYLGQDYSNSKMSAGQITVGMIDMLCKQSFPPCMSQLHSALRSDHHLKHNGRLQYGLFLKGIGLDLDEALKFWRSEFCRVMDVDKFDKQYAYGVRYNYGREGKRTNYTPYSCIKIVTSNHPGQGDQHGCPFKHCDVNVLRQRLETHGLAKDGIKDIVETVKKGHYQLACGRYFELTHHLDVGTFSPNHPNEYFEFSQKVLNGDWQEKSKQSQDDGAKIVKCQTKKSCEEEFDEETNEDSELMAVEDVTI